MSARVRAPELLGRGWLNTAGPLRLADLRGRVVLLDFWTFCCVNCLHVLDELRPVEEKWHDELVVIGVHSPKFEHEADPAAVRAAVARYDVRHPVLDDPELVTWGAYAARAWPTLVLIDPDGYVAAQYAGEGHAHAIDAMVGELVARHGVRGGASVYVPPVEPDSLLRFPAKAIRLRDGRVLVADAGHGQVLELASERPLLTGLREPNGLCELPAEVAAEVGYDVVVAATVDHQLLGLDSGTGQSRAVAGDGRQWAPGGDTSALSSPWDVAWWQERVWIAMAGIHQLWTFDPRTGAVEVAAGTTNEGLVDGPLDQAWFAQTSGLAPAGDRLWLVDAETSSLRFVEAGQVHTVVGHGLFDFGFRDGDRESALLQHPLGVSVDGEAVLIADTYNGAVRRFDPATARLSTVQTGLAEPSGFVCDGDSWLVVASAAHGLTELVDASAAASGLAARTQRPPTSVAAELVLRVGFTPPPGQKVDERFGPATQLVVTATPPGLIRSGEGRATDLSRRLSLDPSARTGVLHIAARAASCDDTDEAGAACRMHQQDWGIPIVIEPHGPGELSLPLGGVD